MTETLSERLRSTVAHLSTIAPPQLFSVFGAEQRRLAGEHDPATPIQVGASLPTATLADPAGREVTVPAAQRPTVVVFYRGAWCPYCNVALGAYQREVLPELLEQGVDFVAISPQGPDGSLTVAEQNDLAFPVLTDRGNAYARSLGLTFELTEDVQEAQLAFGNDFATINADGDWTLPKPTVIVTDREGVVRFVDVRADYTGRTEPEAILQAVRSLP